MFEELDIVLSYHQVGVADVMFDQPSPQNDHSRVHCPHCLVVYFANIWRKNTRLYQILLRLVIVNLTLIDGDAE